MRLTIYEAVGGCGVRALGERVFRVQGQRFRGGQKLPEHPVNFGEFRQSSFNSGSFLENYFWHWRMGPSRTGNRPQGRGERSQNEAISGRNRGGFWAGSHPKIPAFTGNYRVWPVSARRTAGRGKLQNEAILNVVYGLPHQPCEFPRIPKVSHEFPTLF